MADGSDCPPPAPGLDERVRSASKTMSAHLLDYVSAELSVNAESYACLHELNLAAADRYRGMCDGVRQAQETVAQLSERHAELQPLLQQVGEVEAHVSELEHVVSRLDEYTKRLEHRFRALE